MNMYKRQIFSTVIKRLSEPRRFIQVLTGPRQTGKTTLVQQIIAELDIPSLYATADEPALKDRIWIEQQWQACRSKLLKSGTGILVLDEIQKIPAWSETVKRLWDEDSFSGLGLHVILLGSSPLLVQTGLSESLAGRFETIAVTHWSYPEMRDAFGWNLEQFIYFGGYPGAAPLIEDNQRWRNYIMDSLVETSISRDILLMSRIDKPAMLRRLFELGCQYSGQILSFQKMLGQLQNVGNTVTLSHYLRLLQGAGLLAGLQKYSQRALRQRASSPKFVVLNTALMSLFLFKTFDEIRNDYEQWGRLVESTVGAHLLNSSFQSDIQVFYWAGDNREVDYVLARGKSIAAIEIKSGRRKNTLPGMEVFNRKYDVKKNILVGSSGISVEEFLNRPALFWLE
jgi:predicted AAA+ superfamily ATPase